VLKRCLTKAKVITFAFKQSPSSISAGVNYSTPAGSRWKLTATVLAESSWATYQRRRPPQHVHHGEEPLAPAPYGGDDKTIQAKELEARRLTVLVVRSAA
jgi:hypothetical protein